MRWPWKVFLIWFGVMLAVSAWANFCGLDPHTKGGFGSAGFPFRFYVWSPIRSGFDVMAFGFDVFLAFGASFAVAFYAANGERISFSKSRIGNDLDRVVKERFRR